VSATSSTDLSGLVAEMRRAHADVQSLEADAAVRRARRNTIARDLHHQGMSQRHIAEQLGLSESTVTRLLAFGPFSDNEAAGCS
jgi:DNA-binding NarL/FixJ family response regulator